MHPKQFTFLPYFIFIFLLLGMVLILLFQSQRTKKKGWSKYGLAEVKLHKPIYYFLECVSVLFGVKFTFSLISVFIFLAHLLIIHN